METSIQTSPPPAETKSEPHNQSSLTNNNSSVAIIARPSKPTEAQLSNKQKLKATVDQYEAYIGDLEKSTARLKKQNDYLKQELKALNESLSVTIEKGIGAAAKRKEDPEPKQIGNQQYAQVNQVSTEVIKKELENSNKQIANYQKEIASLKLKVEAVGPERVHRMENELKEKDQKIEEVTKQLRTLEKLQRSQHNTDVYKLNEEIAHKLNIVVQENTFLKRKLAEAKNSQENLQKSIKKKQQYLLKKETTATRQSASPAKQSSSRQGNSFPDAVVDETELNKFKQTVSTLEYSNKVLEKRLKTETDALKTRCRMLEQQNLHLKDKLQNKQKQANITAFRLNQLKRKIPSQNSTTLEPLQVKRSMDPASHNFERRKQFKGLTTISQINKKFDDSMHFGIEKNYRIAKMAFTWQEQSILSLTTDYELADGTTKSIPSFTVQSPSSISAPPSKCQVVFEGYEYISSLEGLCNKQIQFLRITTSRGTVFNIGSDKNQPKCKRFSFDIRNNQKPIAVMGIIDNKKIINGQFSDVLVSFGLEIKRKQVTLGKQPSEYNSAMHKSLTVGLGKRDFKVVPSTKPLSEHQEVIELNDKNMIRENPHLQQ